MDDDYKDYKRTKPQQKLYKPGSGPLRRSGYGAESKMHSYHLENNFRDRNSDQIDYGSQNSINSCGVTNTNHIRQKKPEQQLYVPRSAEYTSDNRHQKQGMNRDNASQYNNRRMSNKQEKQANNGLRGSSRRDRSYNEYQNKDSDINFNRSNRQISEPRTMSPINCSFDKTNDRNRDTRSMETSAGRHIPGAGGKPPTGRRNSSGYPNDVPRPKFMVNLDNMPPRFRKKYLEQSGHHSFDSVDQISREQPHLPNYHYNQGQSYNSNSGWSQTLPSRGRGRLRDTENFDREKFMNSFMKNYDLQHSRRSTPSSSYINLYEMQAIDSQNVNTNNNKETSSIEKDSKPTDIVSKNCANNTEELSHNHQEDQKKDSDKEESEPASYNSINLLEITSLDWTEEVEKNLKLDDLCDTSTSFSQNFCCMSVSQTPKPVEHLESKRSARSKHRDKRSSSRGKRNTDRKHDRTRKDSNVSLHQETMPLNPKQKERERRDSHRSNRSSNVGNSRDDLDRWRSLRSYSREQSVEGRIVSQCNSRDVSSNRAGSPRDSDGFRVPSAVSKGGAWPTNNQKKNGAWVNGRTPSIERGRQSPAPSNVSVGGEGGGGGRRRKSKQKRGSRRSRLVDPAPVSHATNWREEIIESKKNEKQTENVNQRNRLNSVMSDKSVSESSSTSHPGLLVLPQGSLNQMQREQIRAGSVETQKTLYNHHNPSKPIVIQTSPGKMDVRLERGVSEMGSGGDAGRAARHRALLQEVDRADAVLQAHLLRRPRALLAHWPALADTRKVLQNALQKLLMSDLKYCQADNVEHQFWKILYYNFIEVLRNSISQGSPEDKKAVVELINKIIEEGNLYFENLIVLLEKTYKFNTDDYVNDSHLVPPKGLGYIGLALISVQKLYVFLGDLARYKEQVNESSNYAKSKFWYTKAQQINPKNGRPYNQLAILAIYARRKLDAVYYYMRSLMSSNPFHSARESLLSLFDENRKKYEAAERKRRLALESSRVENGDACSNGCQTVGNEIWIRPGEAKCAPKHEDKDDEFNSMTPVELNKNFITSYLHVHGKIITKIGMESFDESAGSMVRQFRALLARQPLPTPAARLLQLTALNMFAVETCARAPPAPPTSPPAGGESSRSAWLDCAVSVSLLMFGALLERCCALLPSPAHSQQHADALHLLPAIKAWSDWMLCHSSVWNPPPSFEAFGLNSKKDPFDWLANLMNILEELDDKTIELESKMKEGMTCIRLSEDATLAGFTPLMYIEPSVAWTSSDLPQQALEHALRTRKLLFFGTEYLVGVDPAVLRLAYPADAAPHYVSAVPPRVLPKHQAPLDKKEEEEDIKGVSKTTTSLDDGLETIEGTDEFTKKLLRRKEQLESRNATHDKQVQKIDVR